MNRHFAGIDIGASYTKCVVIDENAAIKKFAVTQTGFDFE